MLSALGFGKVLQYSSELSMLNYVKKYSKASFLPIFTNHTNTFPIFKKRPKLLGSLITCLGNDFKIK